MWYRRKDYQPFETEEAARQAALEDMTIEDYQGGELDFEKILKWCFKQNGFIETFDEELKECEEYYFQLHFIEED